MSDISDIEELPSTPPHISKKADNAVQNILPQKSKKVILAAENLIEKDVPIDLPFGASTSAYQIEGAWNESGKGESIWDYYFHNVETQAPGDIACDSYHRYKEDIRLAANLGFKMFRFSISWTRILPTGYTDNINQAGIDHYKNVVDEMLKYNITPVCTIYHWDLPQQLYADGIHWNSTKLIPYFVDFARIVIKNLPGVGVWITINEPRQLCHLGYGLGYHAPNIKGDGTDEYLCAYTTMKAHAAVYRMYKEEFPNYTDFFVWGFVKDRVYNPMPATIEELKNNIRQIMENIPLENLMVRFHKCIDQEGRHIEH